MRSQSPPGPVKGSFCIIKLLQEVSRLAILTRIGHKNIYNAPLYSNRTYISIEMIYCATNNIYCFISIMCTYNAQPIITLLFFCFCSLNHMNLCKKNLLFRSHPRSLVYATAVSLVLIGCMWTTCRPKPCPSPFPTPYLSPVPDQGHQENWGGEGEESQLVISCLLCSNRILPRL